MFRTGQLVHAARLLTLVLQWLHTLCAVALQEGSLSDNTDSIGEVVERNMDLVQAFLKSLLMVCPSTACQQGQMASKVCMRAL